MSKMSTSRENYLWINVADGLPVKLKNTPANFRILKYLDHNSRLQDEIAKQKSSHHTKQHCVSDAPVTSSSPVTGEYDAATDAKLTQILTDNQSLIERC